MVKIRMQIITVSDLLTQPPPNLTLQFQMFENRPESPTSTTTRLQSYFASSSFLNQQQQISIFIKDFPLIKLNEVPSINTLIGLLIKQNSLLAEKCQQQISMLRQSYSKHEGLLRNIRAVKTENTRLQKENIERTMLEEEISRLQASLQSSNQAVIKATIQKNAYSQEEIQAYKKRFDQFNAIFQCVINSEFKKCEVIVRNIDFSGLKSENYQKLFEKNELEASFRDIRKKLKHTKNITQAIFQFCGRLTQVIKVVPATILATELSQQVASFQSLLEEICFEPEIKSHSKNSSRRSPGRSSNGKQSPKMKGSSSKASIKSSSNLRQNGSIFEHLLSKAIDVSQSVQSRQQISAQLDGLKETLATSKEYYENFLMTLRKEYETERTSRQDQISANEETISYYEAQLEKTSKKLEEAQGENIELVSEIQAQTKKLEQSQHRLEDLQNAINKLQTELDSAQNMREKAKEEIWKVNQMQVEQRDSIIEQLKQTRKVERQETEDQFQALKKKYKEADSRIEVLEQELKGLGRQIKTAQQVIGKRQEEIKMLDTKLSYQSRTLDNVTAEGSRKNKELQSFRDTIKQNEHEKSLQISYIQELENKSRVLEGKLQSFQDRKGNEKAAKKELTCLKGSFAEEKKHASNLEQLAYKLKQENRRFKSMIHEMKGELEDVYVRLNKLKQIEEDRERLMFEAQNSERARNQIMSDYEEIKFGLMQIEAQNKALSLEVKYYKSALVRIEGLHLVVDPV